MRPRAFSRRGSLAALRFLQGVGLGGEWGGAALIATENAPDWPARLVRHVPQLGPADRLLHRDRPLPRPPDRIWRSGVRRLGLARPVPRERDPGRDRTLCSRRPRGDAGLQGGDGARQADRRPPRRSAARPFGAADPGLGSRSSFATRSSNRDRLHAWLWREIARHVAGEPARDAVRGDPLHGRGDAGLGGARRPRRPASGAAGLGRRRGRGRAR